MLPIQHLECGSPGINLFPTILVKQVKTRPHFIKSPADVRATEGETLTLEAEVEGTPSPEILWSLDGEEVTNGDATFHNNIAR